MGKKYITGMVSVITPLYNAEKYIKETIYSVLNQTYKDIEMILIDDCSTDDSAKKIKELCEQHSEIVYFKQIENLGAGIARNKALEMARGQYVAFLDSDDLWMPDKIEKQIQLMKKKGSPFSYTAIEMVDENGGTIKEKRNVQECCDYNYLLRNTLIATSTVVIDRDMLGDFRMSLRRGGQDYATWLGLLRTGIVANGLNENLVKYRIRSNSLSSNKLKSIKQIWEIQTQDEKINKFDVVFNIICFGINAIKKYYF